MKCLSLHYFLLLYNHTFPFACSSCCVLGCLCWACTFCMVSACTTGQINWECLLSPMAFGTTEVCCRILRKQRAKIPRQNFMGSLENCLLLILLRLKPAWCKTAQQQPFQPIMVIYSSVLSGPNSIMVSIAGPLDNRCQSAMCETSSAWNLRFNWSKKNQPEAETTWITKSNLRGSRQRGRWQGMQCSVALPQTLFHTHMNICQIRP